jgi:hypothetical protein
MRRKKWEFIGTAEYGEGGSWIEPLEQLIDQAKAEGDTELADVLEQELKKTRYNMAHAGEDHAKAAEEAARLERDRTRELATQVAGAAVVALEDRAAERQAQKQNQGKG